MEGEPPEPRDPSEPPDLHEPPDFGGPPDADEPDEAHEPPGSYEPPDLREPPDFVGPPDADEPGDFDEPLDPGDRPEHPEAFFEDELPLHTHEELAQRRARERAARKRAGQRRLLVLIISIVVLVVIIVIATGSGGGSKPPVSASTARGSAAAHLGGNKPAFLTVKTDTAVLPLNVLIADRGNDRLISISPTGQVIWQMKQASPGEAYVSRTGRTVVVSEHSQSVVVLRRIDNQSVSYIYGHSGHRGSSDNYLHNPRAAQETSTGEVVLADSGNCRILFIPQNGRHVPLRKLGIPGQCVHHVTGQPYTFADPVSAFPTSDGGLVVTESSPAWVDVLSKTDRLVSQIELTGFSAPASANEYAPGDLIIVDRSRPGKIEEFSETGKEIWTYDVTSGPGELDRPTVAQVLPDKDVLVVDSGNDRVVWDPLESTCRHASLSIL